MWGGVGRGKTFLMDLFFECLPFPEKLRTHFHRFMHRVHRDLTRFSRASPDPLRLVAAGLASEARVLCFDEFFVSDIGDAMILGELLAHLFDAGSHARRDVEHSARSVVRERSAAAALPAGDRADRAQYRGDQPRRRHRLSPAAARTGRDVSRTARCNAREELLAERFATLAPDHATSRATSISKSRAVRSAAGAAADDVAWFDFDALCDGPRSQNDYIELARLYHAVLVSDVPIFTTRQRRSGAPLHQSGRRVLRPQRQADRFCRGAGGDCCIRAKDWRSSSSARAAGCSKCVRTTIFRGLTEPEPGDLL